jgi:mannose-6-phosphate isomerase-like protein (cupin superfamily)
MHYRPLGAWHVERPSRWRRIAFPLTFLAGGLTFIVLPSMLASSADAGHEVTTRRAIWEPPPEPMEMGRVSLLRGTDIRATLQRLKPDARGFIYSSSLDRRAQFILNRRTGPSIPELHADWDDVIVFQSGMGTLRFGGRLIGARSLGDTERRGGKLDNEFVTKIEPGDVLRIPAGVPHQLEPLGDAPLVYLVMKLKAPLEVLPKHEHPEERATGSSDS